MEIFTALMVVAASISFLFYTLRVVRGSQAPSGKRQVAAPQSKGVELVFKSELESLENRLESRILNEVTKVNATSQVSLDDEPWDALHLEGSYTPYGRVDDGGLSVAESDPEIGGKAKVILGPFFRTTEYKN